MTDVKANVAKNITELRLLNGLTQMELGEKLSYSDKTISKWERGESTPDISVLVEIANIFGVTVDYLVRSENIDRQVESNRRKETVYNRRAITYMSESLVLLIAVLVYIVISLIDPQVKFQWLCFVYAIPVAMIVRLVFNSIWFNPRNNYYIISMMMWSILAAIHITCRYCGVDMAIIYLLGVVGQLIILLWSFVKKPKKVKVS